ncbi:MAG: hypothetical protein JWP57_4253 [Spirosoma sp.]|nr:hypothetical protein [Spirosoma sp.]
MPSTPAANPVGRPRTPTTPGRDLKKELAHLDKWLTANSATIKPQGIAIAAGIPPADLSKMRNGGATAVTAAKVDAIVKEARRYGYAK